MRDDERIKMYYRFGLLDWKSELYQAELKKQKSDGIRNLSLKYILDLKRIFSMFFRKHTTRLFGG